jgi:hypothetical protein
VVCAVSNSKLKTRIEIIVGMLFVGIAGKTLQISEKIGNEVARGYSRSSCIVGIPKSDPHKEILQSFFNP